MGISADNKWELAAVKMMERSVSILETPHFERSY